MTLDDIVADDYGQTIVLTILDTDTGLAADVSAYTTSVQIQLIDPDGNIATKTAAYITDGSDGQVEYTLQDGDIDASGTWHIRARVTGASAVLTSRWERFAVTP